MSVTFKVKKYLILVFVNLARPTERYSLLELCRDNIVSYSGRSSASEAQGRLEGLTKGPLMPVLF